MANTLMLTATSGTGSGIGTIATASGYQALPESMKKQQGFQPRRFDLCMVFKFKTDRMVKFQTTSGAGENQDELMARVAKLKEPTPAQKNKMQAWTQRRESLMKAMKNCGLNLFCFYSRDRDEIIVKIGADAEKLCATAARMKYKLQMKPEFLGAYAEYRQDFPGRPDRGFKDRRLFSHMYERHSEDDNPDEGSIFTTRDKIFLIHHIISSKDKDCAGINIGQLLNEDVGEKLLQHYFPLHEDRKLQELDVRSLAKMKNWIFMSTEHSHKVRDYFGDKVAFFYLFLAFYWVWLAVPGVIGVALQVVDVLFHTPDNFTAVPFCMFLAVWTSFLPHFWRRQENKYAIAWGTFDMVPELETCRPEHFGEPRINPVTAQVEPYYPWQKRMFQYMISSAVIFITGIVLVCLILGLILARHKFNDDVPGGIAGWQFIMAIFVEIVNAVLTVVAKNLTNLENHRTQSEHDTHLLAKVFAFKFINSYFVLYYVAFFKSHVELFGTKMKCLRDDDCFLDLQLALAIFMLVRMIVQNAVEFVCPKLRLKLKGLQSETYSLRHNLFNPSSRLELADMSAAELQSKRAAYDPFQDFDETLITHGYATLFAVTSPWVCTASLIWILARIILDVKNLTESTQRPLPVRMRKNEPWDTAFDIYGVLAMFTNITLLIFASKEFIMWTFTEKLVLFIYLVHLTFFAKLIIQAIFPEVPRTVALLQLKQANMVHRCLENIKVEPQQDFSLFRDHGADHFEVLEQDIFDDDDSAEPEFSMMASWRNMTSNIKQTLDMQQACVWMSVILLIVSLTLCALFAAGLFVYNQLKGHFQ